MALNPPPRDLISFRYSRRRHNIWKQLVLARVNLLPTRSVLHRIDRSRPVDCRHCHSERETNLHALNACTASTQAMISRHNRVRDRFMHAIKKQGSFHADVEPRIRTEDNDFLQPDLILLDRQTRGVRIVDFAVTYETGTDSIDSVYRAKSSKYNRLKETCAKLYKTCPEDVDVVPLIVGSRGAIPEKLLANLAKLNLSKSTARAMATTAAEQSIWVFNTFAQRHRTWKPPRKRFW